MRKSRFARLLLLPALLVVVILAFTVIRTYASANANIKILMYNGNTALQSNTISPRLRIINEGTTTIRLSDLKVRYYYTEDGNQSQQFWCDWSTRGASNVTGRFVHMKLPAANADSYVEIGFKSNAGDLAPGANVEAQVRLTKVDWSGYTQSNDYSFNPSTSTYVSSQKVSGYVSDTLSWGSTPGGLPTKATPTQSLMPIAAIAPKPTVTKAQSATPTQITTPTPMQPSASSPTATPAQSAVPNQPGTDADRYFPTSMSVAAMQSGASNITKQQVKALIETQVDQHWSVIQSVLGLTTKEKAYALFLGLATRESTFQASLETGSGAGHSYGPLQTAETAYAKTNKNYLPEDDVPEILQYDFTPQNYYDPGIAVHMGIRHLIHYARQAKAAGYTGIETIRRALIGYNTGFVTNSDPNWMRQYSDETGALAGWYLTNNHLTDAAFTWTSSPDVNRTNPWGWY